MKRSVIRDFSATFNIPGLHFSFHPGCVLINGAHGAPYSLGDKDGFGRSGFTCE
jgi:hypothetical protein